MLLKMLTSLSGPEFTLSPSDTHDFEGELVDGEVTGEAGRLIAAGFAVAAEDSETFLTPAIEPVEPVVEPVMEQVVERVVTPPVEPVVAIEPVIEVVEPVAPAPKSRKKAS